MREVVTYVAYDDTEFNNRDECEEYELKAEALIRSIENKFTFYDRNMKPIRAPLLSSEVAEWLTWLDNAYKYASYVRKAGSLTDDEAEIIRENIGACLYNEEFSCAVGLFRYDTNMRGWVKVDE